MTPHLLKAIRLLQADARKYQELANEFTHFGQGVRVPLVERNKLLEPDYVAEVNAEKAHVAMLTAATGFRIMSQKLDATLKRLKQP